jgi:RNA polymerase sigma-70 factor (ECF subfamily)
MAAELPPEWITTSTVLERLSDFGDRGAWDRFAERFHRPIQAFAKKQGLAEHECADLAQETLLAFAEAYRRGEYDRTKGRLSNWLFGIAWRRIDHARRKADRRAEREGDALDSRMIDAHDVPSAASAEWQELWERSILEHCLRQMRKESQPATFRAFEMLVLEKRSIEDAERELGMTRNAIAIAKHRVSARLRELVAQCDEVRP